MVPREPPALSRRAVVRAGVLAGLGLTVPSAVRASERVPHRDPTDRPDAAQSASAELTVATRNLGLGANLFSLFLVESADDLARAVGDLYADIERSAVTARMTAIADELVRTRPDVVGVQEAALVRTGSPDDDGAADPDAETVAFDFLADLTDALDAAGHPYDVVQVTRNADAEFPGVVDGDRTDVRLTDRDAVLVRADADVRVTASSATRFEESLAYPVDDRTLTVERGYGVVAATVGETAFTVVNTHLESASERVRGAQADELADGLDAIDGPTVLLCDLNDGPAFGGGAYETLAAELTDAWATARPDADGATCCRATTLDGPGSMVERLDHVLVSGFAATDARLVGVGPDSRVTATIDGQSRTVWPSDHAGVVATLRPAAEESTTTAGEIGTGDETATPAPEETAETETQSAEDAATPTNATRSNRTSPSANASSDRGAGANASAPDDPDESVTPTDAPGFGVAAGALGVLGGAAGLLRRRGRE